MKKILGLVGVGLLVAAGLQVDVFSTVAEGWAGLALLAAKKYL